HGNSARRASDIHVKVESRGLAHLECYRRLRNCAKPSGGYLHAVTAGYDAREVIYSIYVGGRFPHYSGTHIRQLNLCICDRGAALIPNEAGDVCGCLLGPSNRGYQARNAEKHHKQHKTPVLVFFGKRFHLTSWRLVRHCQQTLLDLVHGEDGEDRIGPESTIQAVRSRALRMTPAYVIVNWRIVASRLFCCQVLFESCDGCSPHRPEQIARSNGFGNASSVRSHVLRPQKDWRRTSSPMAVSTVLKSCAPSDPVCASTGFLCSFRICMSMGPDASSASAL